MLAGEGKNTWQGRQALEALKVFYQRVEPLKWAEHGFDIELEGMLKETLEDGVRRFLIFAQPSQREMEEYLMYLTLVRRPSFLGQNEARLARS